MNKREQKAAHVLRDRVHDAMSPAQRVEARAAWVRAWESKRDGILNKDVTRARLAMLSALGEGKSIADAEQVARVELARAA